MKLTQAVEILSRSIAENTNSVLYNSQDAYGEVLRNEIEAMTTVLEHITIAEETARALLAGMSGGSVYMDGSSQKSLRMSSDTADRLRNIAYPR